MNKSIAIIIPTIGREKYLDQAIESAIKQNEEADEIVIFDNSIDQNIEITSAYGGHQKITWLKSGSQLNAIDSWNTAFSRCRSEYVITCGDDDILMPNCVKEAKKILVDSRFGILKAIQINSEGEKTKILPYPKKKILYAEEAIDNRNSGRLSLYVPGMLFEKKLFEAVGGYVDTNIEGLSYADELLFYKLCIKADGVSISEEVCWKYRLHDEQISGVKRLKGLYNKLSNLESLVYSIDKNVFLKVPNYRVKFRKRYLLYIMSQFVKYRVRNGYKILDDLDVFKNDIGMSKKISVIAKIQALLALFYLRLKLTRYNDRC